MKKNELVMHIATRLSHNVSIVKNTRSKKYILHGLYLYKILESENQAKVIAIRLVIAWRWCGWGWKARRNKKRARRNF